jgi:cold shock protein
VDGRRSAPTRIGPNDGVHVTDDPDLQRRTAEIRIQPSTRTTGTVRWFSAEKGYGFLVPDDGPEDVFVRYSSIEREGFRTLEPGQRVSFDVGDDGRGPRATAVRPA